MRMPERLDADEAARFAALGLDAAVVAAYGLILPKPVLAAPRLGCLNVHASLLPRWRGAAPIQRAILAGDSETGVTIMQMDEGLDTGPMLLAEARADRPETTAAALHDALAALGARLIVAALEGRADGQLVPQPQPRGRDLRQEAEARRGAARLAAPGRRARARRCARSIPRPAPGSSCGDERIKVLAAARAEAGAGAAPGTVLDARLTHRLRRGRAAAARLQRAGARRDGRARPSCAAFAIAAGTVLPCPATS